MTDQFHLGVALSSRSAWVFRSIPDYDPTICAHGGNDVGILWLIARLINLPLVVNLLHNVEFDLHWGWLFRGTSSITADFFPLFIVIG